MFLYNVLCYEVSLLLFKNLKIWSQFWSDDDGHESIFKDVSHQSNTVEGLSFGTHGKKSSKTFFKKGVSFKKLQYFS